MISYRVKQCGPFWEVAALHFDQSPPREQPLVYYRDFDDAYGYSQWLARRALGEAVKGTWAGWLALVLGRAE